MSITYGPNLGLLENANTGEAHDSALRAFLRGVDGLVMPNVKGYLTNTPPVSPSSGDCYIIGAAPTGAWAGKAAYITRWSVAANAWEFYAPHNGWMLQANSARESYRYTAGTWEIYYQEGTWTPVLGGGWSNSGAPRVVGVFIKNGGSSFVKAEIAGANKGGTGTISCSQASAISGLPFTSSSDFVTYASNSIGGPNYGTSTGGGTIMYAPAMAANSDQINVCATYMV